jgi:hypothetical protein
MGQLGQLGQGSTTGDMFYDGSRGGEGYAHHGSPSISIQGDANVHHLSGTVCGEKRGSQRGTVSRYAS